MQEFTVTDGRIEYAHTKPLADYENKVGRVSFSFTVAEGADPQAAASKVLSMAMELVEGQAIQGQVMAKVVAEPVSLPVTVKSPEVVQEEVASRKAKAAVVVEPETEAEPEPVVTHEEMKAFLPKVLDHLRKEFGHVNDMRKLISSYDVISPADIPEEQRFGFMEKARGLLSLKKEG